MKKTLILMRHAKTEQAALDQRDFDRNLTNRGEADALKMATLLKESAYIPDIIMISSANRTVQTAAIVAQQLNCHKNKIHILDRFYLADAQTLAEELEYLEDNVQSCCIIAHNPGISEFAYHCKPNVIGAALPTSGVVIFSFEANSWRAFTKVKKKLELYEYPKKSI